MHPDAERKIRAEVTQQRVRDPLVGGVVAVLELVVVLGLVVVTS